MKARLVPFYLFSVIASPVPVTLAEYLAWLKEWRRVYHLVSENAASARLNTTKYKAVDDEICRMRGEGRYGICPSGDAEADRARLLAEVEYQPVRAFTHREDRRKLNEIRRLRKPIGKQLFRTGRSLIYDHSG
jgi:hypothetical protein